MLFAPTFVDVEIESPVFVPGAGGDARELGVRVSGVEVDGVDQFGHAQLVDGFHGLEHGAPPESTFRWSSAKAAVRVPVDPFGGRGDGGPVVGEARLRLAAEAAKDVTLRCGDHEVVVAVGTEPT